MMPAKVTTSDGEIGRRIALLRKRKGIRQKELAEMIGVLPSCICLYELGREFVPLGRRAAIAQALGLNASALADPALMEVTPDERDLISAYRKAVSVWGRTASQRVMSAIGSVRESGLC